MPDNPIEVKPTIFLDTNALIYIGSYLEKAKELRLPPYSEQPLDFAEISMRINHQYPHSISGYYMKGCKSLAYLQQKTVRLDGEIGARIFTSRFSKVEMLYGAFDGRAHIVMAKQGVPYRMRQRATDLSELISMKLNQDEIDDVVRIVDELFILLENKDNILLEFVEDGHNTENISLLSEFLHRRVFLDVIDVWIYSCAITIQAEQIICFDGFFRDVINRINSGTEKWTVVRREMKDFVKKLWSWNMVVVPKCIDIPQAAPNVWPI